jgi:membrane protein DedA with SNARE-associated domain/membrane-associated phospholipid phosphatase
MERRRGEVHVSRVTDTILSLHGWVALLVVFLLPALEASVFFGVIFPGEIAVILGGVLAFQHRVGLSQVLAAAVIGAVAGDTVGYLVGRRWGRRMLHGSLRRFIKAHHLDQAEAFLARHGGKAVFFGRWTAALRALIPGLAGMSGVHYRTFAIWNVLGGGLWAATFVLVGFVAGEGWRKVEAIAKRASLVLLLIVVLVAAILWAGRWVAQHPERVRAAIDRQLQRPRVARLRARYERQLAFLARRLRPGGALGLSLTLGLLAIGVAGWAFGAVARAVLASSDLTQFDGFVERFFAGHREPWLTAVLHGAVGLGGAWLLVAVGLAAGLGLRLARGRWQPLLLLLGAWAGAELLALSVDALVRRPRPPLGLVAADGFAFPSREATAAAAVYGMLVALSGVATSRWSLRAAAATGAMLALALLGLGEVYLGANWLSDVLGGLALGGLWLFVLLTVVRTLVGWRASSRGRRDERAEVKA